MLYKIILNTSVLKVFQSGSFETFILLHSDIVYNITTRQIPHECSH